ncbi:ABC transporter ATP-binding protein [Wenzhouxiangella marina]|uniref:Sugar ABC transporter ATP-binding protein n=1 Tax=Wenzhouxiangella marina TaxID=1579979 RepID=A0A0K0XT94_9GAMM|nr:ABC transporter ATP-binding protein [Wenzhouxiangella marina]AKS40880.1 Sugar ABC transporter ATP-binding protein [Wenzhouxiangella marina]MBB6087754.1 lipopolysaccharide transport system ATP-binding protein [Wenzhouxiangella marina]
MTRCLLELDRVGKVFPRTNSSSERLSAFWSLLRGREKGNGTLVLDEISFQVRPGESMGIIGSNGAGKSTLLKLITGVLAPSRGRISQSGTSAALLELGAGFDPEYTGLENLRLNAALFGLSPSQVNERLDDILGFADIGDSINEPVKHYSSGMVVRLGFAIVASIRPDLLITDEVLAVGDESFQKKCIRWIEDYLETGGTLLMVSHNMYQVQKLCRHALWLQDGRARALGDVFDVTQAYLAWHERRDAEDVQRAAGHAGADHYGVTELVIEGAEDAEPRLEMGQSLAIRLHLRSPDGRAPVALIGLVRADGTPVYGVASDHDGAEVLADERGGFVARLRFPNLSLLPGGYVVRGHAMDPEGLRVHDTAELPFTVMGRSRELGLVRLEHEWLP